MAHIVSCMLDVDGDQTSVKSYIGKLISPQASTDSLVSTTSSYEEKKPFIWRMHQPSESRKYGLFPTTTPRERERERDRGKQLDPEQVAAAIAQQQQQAAEKSEKGDKASGLRMRIKEHNLIRRRKVSVPELGPMTTVQEVAMDSRECNRNHASQPKTAKLTEFTATIPGRPPLHERSISSPVNGVRHQHVAEALIPTHDIPDENAELSTSAPTDSAKSKSRSPTRRNPPQSPKNLAPLMIPGQASGLPRLARQLSLGRLRAGTAPSESTGRSVRTDDSPRTRTPFTPMTASSYNATPRSALTISTVPTPISAVPTENQSRESPRPWEKSDNATPVGTPPNGSTDPNTTPKLEAEPQVQRSGSQTHRRNVSETGSIMERGRPRKKSDGSAVGGPKRSNSKKSKSDEQRAFETLPQGYRPTEAAKSMDQNEALYLHKQALGQALRFEVLKKDDVEALSRELRHLDERTEYLRRTYTSLRAGRRNLHSRICQYLRSPRVAKFSHDSMLKQEEALAELDASIDDWVTKLEHAENRRTRVRQKLLEHVAAAACMAMPTDIAGVSESLHQALGIRLNGPSDISTPPRSPTKAGSFTHLPSPSPSPQRVVARVPSVIPEVPAEEYDRDDARSTLKRMESIRIYADHDVYALLADVENEFTKLGASPSTTPEPLTETQRKELNRARSHDVLNGGFVIDKTPPNSPPAPSPPLKDTPSNTDGDFFLTSAVFQPTTVSA